MCIRKEPDDTDKIALTINTVEYSI